MDLTIITTNTNLTEVASFTKKQIEVLIDQCETALSDMIRMEGSDGCTTSNVVIAKGDKFLGKLIDIYNSK